MRIRISGPGRSAYRVAVSPPLGSNQLARTVADVVSFDLRATGFFQAPPDQFQDRSLRAGRRRRGFQPNELFEESDSLTGMAAEKSLYLSLQAVHGASAESRREKGN